MKRYKKLTILHSNDMHGSFNSEIINGKAYGGVSLLSGYINSVREKEENTVYTISGDMFSGSVIDSEYKGMSTIEILNLISPDVVTIGNHEVDYGLAHLLLLEKCAKFPIINANMYIKTNNVRLFRSHMIINRGGIKILFIGIMTADVMLQVKKDALISSLIDIKPAVQEVTRLINNYKHANIDLTVLLTHIGLEADIKLAKELDPVLGVDLIIGGHSHTRMSVPVVENGILIAQAYTGTDTIGRFDLILDTFDNTIREYSWESVSINEDNCPHDRELDELVTAYSSSVTEKYGRVLGMITPVLTHPGRYIQTNLGSFVADIYRDCLNADIAFVTSGSIRVQALGPTVTYGDINELHPFNEDIHLLKLSGASLSKIFRYIYRADIFENKREFYQISRDTYVEYNPELPERTAVLYKGKPLSETKTYGILVQDFTYLSLEKLLGINSGEIISSSVAATSSIDILEEYFITHFKIIYSCEKRLVDVSGRVNSDGGI